MNKQRTNCIKLFGLSSLMCLIFVSLFCVPNVKAQSVLKATSSNSKKLTCDTSNIWKRFSIHTNVVDWAFTVPNIGIEYDFTGKPTNNRSVAFFVKYNPNTHHTIKPRIVFDVTAFRAEYRKYFRVGNVGSDGLARPYPKIKSREHIQKHRDNEEARYMKGEHYNFYQITSSKNPSDSTFETEEDTTQSWFYNNYWKARRNFFSTRTLYRPNNWKGSWYVGGYAAYDKYNLNLTNKGKKGDGIGAGFAIGWTTPLLMGRAGIEGGLDLDFGIDVGAKLVKYRDWTYHRMDNPRENYYDYAADQPNNKWHFVKGPVVQDVHVSLVYRFRSIRHKVSRTIIDDYDSLYVWAFETNIQDRTKKLGEIQELKRIEQDSQRVVNANKELASYGLDCTVTTAVDLVSIDSVLGIVKLAEDLYVRPRTVNRVIDEVLNVPNPNCDDVHSIAYKYVEGGTSRYALYPIVDYMKAHPDEVEANKKLAEANPEAWQYHEIQLKTLKQKDKEAKEQKRIEDQEAKVQRLDSIKQHDQQHRDTMRVLKDSVKAAKAAARDSLIEVLKKQRDERKAAQEAKKQAKLAAKEAKKQAEAKKAEEAALKKEQEAAAAEENKKAKK